jgi:hypothetical protein
LERIDFCSDKGNPTISRADVATFMLDAAHDAQWGGRSAAVSD